MVFQIMDTGGTFVDIMPYIAYNGIKWSRNDVDAANAGRNQQGNMVRDRISTKYRWDITCRPLTAAEQAMMLQLIQPEYITVLYTNPLTNATARGTYYSNNFPSTYLINNGRGDEYWTGLAFPVIQV